MFAQLFRAFVSIRCESALHYGQQLQFIGEMSGKLLKFILSIAIAIGARCVQSLRATFFPLFLSPSPLAHIFSFINYLLNAIPLDGRHIECRAEQKRNAMNFRRSQSKVWFGSQPSVPSVYDNFSSLPTYYHGTGKKSLQSISEQHEESLSPQHSNISSNDADELKRSMLLWGNRKSPSFHSDKSQVRIELLEE